MNKETTTTLKEMKILNQWSNNTYKQYLTTLKDYTTYHQKTLQELIREAETDEENINKLGKRRIKTRLLQYRIYLQETRNFKPNSTKTYLNKIEKIYKYHDIDIPELPKIRITQMEDYTDIPTFKQIQKAIFTARPKMKAIITFIASSGLRRSDTANLTIQDFINATREYHENEYKTIEELLDILDTDRKIIVPTWDITTQKTKIHHNTYSSNESTYYIVEMLRERNKHHPIRPEDSLFGVQANTITHNFQRINNQLRYGHKDTRVFFHPHALRKYFATTLTNNDVDYLATEFMVGHRIRGSGSSYYFANPEKLKNKYMRVMDNFNFTMNVNYMDINSREREEMLAMKKEYLEMLKREKTRERELESIRERLDSLDLSLLLHE